MPRRLTFTIEPVRWTFFISLAVYLALIPWLSIQSWTDGDEPAYLLLAHSLVVDHDFDVGNNYQQKDYRAFYPYDITDQHTVPNVHGEKMLWHDIGTSVLIAPGYWVNGRMGAMVVVNIIAALLAPALFLLAYQLGASEMAAFICSLLFAFSSPLVYYSSRFSRRFWAQPVAHGRRCSSSAI